MSTLRFIKTENQGIFDVALQGRIDETTTLEPYLPQLATAQAIRFFMMGVEYINSPGILIWRRFLAGLRPDAVYSFHHCSVAFASQAAMVPGTIARGPIVSTYAPYFCGDCNLEERCLVNCSEVLMPDASVQPPDVACPQCASPLEFDDMAERYFAFLNA